MDYEDPFGKDENPEPDPIMNFYVFMIVFWPVAIVLGLINYYSLREYDLRLATLAVAALAGWVGVRVYQARERERHEAAG